MMHSSKLKPDPNEITDNAGVRWRKLVGMPDYLIGSNGDIKNIAGESEVLLIPGFNSTGYRQLKLRSFGKMTTMGVHRVVAMAFIDNPDGLKEVNHIDGNKSNNCVENLEWCDHEYNARHAITYGLVNPRESTSAVLTEALARKIYLDFYINHTPLSEICVQYNVNISTARGVIYKHSWVGITDALDAQYGIVSKNKNVEYLTENEVKEIYLLYRLRSMTAQEIQKDFPHLSIGVIQAVMYKETWTKITDKMDKEYKFPERRTITPMDKELVKSIYLDLRVNGFTQKDVQQKYKLSRGTISNIVYKNRWKDFTDELDKEYNIPPYSNKINPKLDEETVIECYKLMKSGYTSRQVSNMKNISNDVLRMIWKKKSWKKTTDMVDLKMDYKL